jgi:PPOX class probable F420-dependent enzyme
MTKIPETFADLMKPEKKAFAALGLVRKDGTPHVTMVWFDYDGTLITINTARGRVKDNILRRHPCIALSILDPNNPYRYIQVMGQVVDETEEGAYEKICDLNLKYHGNRDYPKRPGEVRVTYKILPERMSKNG